MRNEYTVPVCPFLPENLSATVDTTSWPVPPVFNYLLSFAEVEFAERYRTFNMGIGFVVILPETEAARAKDVLQRAGETVHRIGRTHRQTAEKVTLTR